MFVFRYLFAVDYPKRIPLLRVECGGAQVLLERGRINRNSLDSDDNP